MSKSRRVAYWVTTGIVALIMSSGGLFQVIQQSGAVEGITSLGYPVYFVVILGVWKMLGGVVMVVPRLPRLKEWAYAGTIFDLSGAVFSHVVRNSDVGHIVWPLGLAALAVASWALRPDSRKLPGSRF